MSSIVPFSFESLQVRVTTDEQGEPWFFAQDLAEVLEYSSTNAMNKLVDEEERRMVVLQNGVNYYNQSLISEAGLYQAIFNSTKTEAKAFRKWVTKEVLPQIRKTGSYSAIPAAPPAPVDFQEEFRKYARQQAADNYKLLMAMFDGLGLSPEDLGRRRAYEAELLNMTVLGMKSREFSNWYEAPRPIRESMAPQQLAAFSYLEGVDMALLSIGMEYLDRAKALEAALKTMFPAVAEFRDQQVRLLSKRFEEKDYKLFPEHPQAAKALCAPHQLAKQMGFIP